MTALAGHVADAVIRRHPHGVVPIELRSGIARMGQVGCQLAQEAGQALQDRDPDRARALQTLDDEMDRLHRNMFTIWDRPDWWRGVGPAVDTALLSRYYERFRRSRCVHPSTGRVPGNRGSAAQTNSRPPPPNQHPSRRPEIQPQLPATR